MRFRKNILPPLTAALLLVCGGCSAFRDMFSDPGAEKRRSDRARQEQTKRGDDRTFKSRRYNRDPLDSLIFNDRNRTPDWAGSNLTRGEREALRYSMDPEPDARREIDKVYLDGERQRRQRADWVFGPNPFRQ